MTQRALLPMARRSQVVLYQDGLLRELTGATCSSRQPCIDGNLTGSPCGTRKPAPWEGEAGSAS